MFFYIQLSILKSSIVEVELPTDIAITAVLHKAAAKHNYASEALSLQLTLVARSGVHPERWEVAIQLLVRLVSGLRGITFAWLLRESSCVLGVI